MDLCNFSFLRYKFVIIKSCFPPELMSFYPALQHYDYQNIFHAQTRMWCEGLFYICVIHWVFFVKLFSKDFKLIPLLYFSSSALNGKNHMF